MIKKHFWGNLILSLFGLTLQGCGDSCNFANRLFNEPACKSLRLESSRSIPHIEAACSAAPNSKKISVQCPFGSGTANQCSSVANGFPVIVFLVPNNAGGSFLDGNGTTYTSCGQLLQDLGNALVQNIAGVYFSDNSTVADTLNCDDVSGCTLTQSGNCLAGWDPVLQGPNGTASFTSGDQYLACVYIDNSSEALNPPPPPPAVGTWTSPMQQVTISGSNTLSFSSGWGDAY